ncbi:hypothetical protein C7387_1718 [Yokenella regensburgei]|uniref:Uncharacterized protein n=1 Tax=Yokenella regensburgei TaxID=158877 RepID=A0ABX9S2M3_9ENTR|nr:hypothetical protein [Yokenella regensburgei]RKR64999.1 hypothetical protein C7387_1718 [Yokenella regensburgei]VFS14533.1 Uncharacterised protein [Yokenella regensburgei]
MDCSKEDRLTWQRIYEYRNVFFFLLIILWLGLYLFCHLLSTFTNMTEDAFVVRCRAFLNVLITSVVLFITFKQRFIQYKLLARITNGVGDLPHFPELFVPMGLALVPFSSAMTDLAETTRSYELVMSLCLGVLFLVTLLETVVVCFFEMSRSFLKLFSAHIVLLIFIAWGALVDKTTLIKSLTQMGLLKPFS